MGTKTTATVTAAATGTSLLLAFVALSQSGFFEKTAIPRTVKTDIAVETKSMVRTKLDTARTQHPNVLNAVAISAVEALEKGDYFDWGWGGGKFVVAEAWINENGGVSTRSEWQSKHIEEWGVWMMKEDTLITNAFPLKEDFVAP